MTRPRNTQISLDATPYYHCVTRCVRRAFLCGEDKATGVSYEHRRQWIEDRLLQLQSVFSIDLCAYAVMSNHYHVVLHVDAEQAQSWQREEVIRRWHQLFKGTVLTQKVAKGQAINSAESKAVDDVVAVWRARLMDISWFIRSVNETIARAANVEDECRGRFWEGRFKSQALLDEKALIACMAYVDLNPVRAKMASTPEASDHTSIKQRAEKIKTAHNPHHPKQQPAALMPFVGDLRQDRPKGLPFRVKDYVTLVDWTGRHLRSDKRGAIDDNLPPILTRLAIEPKHWLYMTTRFESKFKGLVGAGYRIKQAAETIGIKKVHGVAQCRLMFGV